MTEPRHFQKLQHQFFKDYAKKVEIGTSRVLFTSFHPAAATVGDHILLLEQIYSPENVEFNNLEPFTQEVDHSFDKKEDFTIKLNQIQAKVIQSEKDKDDSSRMMSDESMNIDEKIKNGIFLEEDQNTNYETSHRKEEEQAKFKVNYQFKKLKNKNIESGQIQSASQPSNQLQNQRYRESQRKQFRRMQAMNKKDLNRALQLEDEEGEQSPHLLLEKERTFKHQPTNIQSKKYQYIISLWRMCGGKCPLMFSSMTITSSEEFNILNDQIYFSHDGHFIFVILYDKYHILQRALIMNSNDLSLPEIHEYHLDEYHIIASEVQDNPALIWGNRDCFNLEYARPTMRLSDPYGFASQYVLYISHGEFGAFYSSTDQVLQIPLAYEGSKLQYQIYGILFAKEKPFPIQNEAIIQGTLFKQKLKRNMTFIVRNRHKTDPFGMTLKIYRTSFDKVFEKLRTVGYLTFTDEIKSAQSITHEDLGTSRIHIIADSNMKHIILLSEIDSNSEESQNQKRSLIDETENIEDLKKSLVFLKLIEKDRNLDSVYRHSGTQAAHKYYSKPISIQTFRDPAFNKHTQIVEDIMVSVFNENCQSYVAFRASDMFLKEDETKNIKEIIEIPQTKIDCQIYVEQYNCFDLIQNKQQKTFTVGEEIASSALMKLYYSSYDDDIQTKCEIQRDKYYFMNPFIVHIRNNNIITISSIFNPSGVSTYQLNHIFLSFVEMYGGSLIINKNVFYRCSTLMFLTLDENHKVVLNILQLPAYIECNPDLLKNGERSFQFYRIKYEHALDYSNLNNDKILKSMVGTIYIPGKSDILVLIIQYENDILVRPFNSTLYHDQFQTGGSKIPMLQQEGQIKNFAEKIGIFVHSIDPSGLQKINLITIAPHELPQMTKVFDLKTSSIVCLSKHEEFLLTMDENLNIKRLSYSQRSNSLRLVKESELIDDAMSMLKYYNSSEFIAMSDTEVYIGPQFYQSYQNLITSKDINTIFESNRYKYIESLSYSNLIKGPIVSLDNSLIMYVYAKWVNDDNPSNELDSFKKAQYARSVREDPSFVIRKRQQSKTTVRKYQQRLNSKSVSKSSSLQLRNGLSTQYNENNIKTQSYNPLTVIQEDNFSFDLSNNVNARLQHEIICIPFLGQKSFQLLHKDNFLLETVQFSTFTLYNDILVMINKHIFIFSQQGFPIVTKINKDDQELLKIENVELVRISNNNLIEAGQTFLFQDNKFYYQYHLKYQNQEYLFQKIYQYEKIKPAFSLSEDKEYYHEGKQDCTGNLYQVLVQADDENDFFVRVNYNMNPASELEGHINKILTENSIKKNSGKPLGYQNISQLEEQMFHFVKEETSLRFDFEILHNKYFIFKIDAKLYYYNLLSYEVDQEFKAINLKLRPGVITQIIQTQRPDVVQFVYVQYCPNKSTFIITWNLETNMEDQLIVFPINQAKPDPVIVRKGVSERLNYYIPRKQHAFYDLRYNFPLNYFNGVSACLRFQMKNLFEKTTQRQFKNAVTEKFQIRNTKEPQLNELKFSQNNHMMLGVTRECFATVYLTYSYMDLQYVEFLLDRYKNHKNNTFAEDTDEKILLRFLKFRLPNGNSILHILGMNTRFLANCFKDVVNLIEDQNYKAGESFFFYAIYPNNNGDSPIDLAIKDRQPRSIELMLDMLAYRPDYNFSKYIQRHFYTLLEMRSESFERFLETCTFSIKKPFKCDWNYFKDFKQFSNHTCYIEDQFLSEQFNVPRDEIMSMNKEINQQQEIIGLVKEKTNNEEDDFYRNPNNEFNCQEGFEYEMFDNLFDKKNNKSIDKQNVIFSAIEFPWIFKGKTAQSFIGYLNCQDKGSTLFNIPTIQNIILFQWTHFRWSYIKYMFIPSYLFYLTIILYTTLTHEQITTEQHTPEMYDNWERAHFGLGGIILGFSLYFILLEISKVYQAKSINKLMIFEWIYLALVVTIVIIHYCKVDDKVFRTISAFVITLTYYQIIFHLQLFDATAVLISMIYQIMKNMIVFLLIFVVIIIGYGNAFFILQGISDDQSIIGVNFVMAGIYAYSTALGGFDTDTFEQLREYQWTLWVLFLTSTIFLSIVMLNLLIAIMGDTYDQVMSVQKEERLRSKCRLINENEFIFNRNRLFVNSRYIIVAKLDTIEKQSSDNWEGKINTMASLFNTKMKFENQKIQSHFKQVKSDQTQVTDLIKQQDTKINEVQNMLLKLSLQLKQQESKKNVKNILKRSSNKIKEYLQAQFLKNKVQESLKLNSERMNPKKQGNPIIQLLQEKDKLSQQ